MEREPEHSGLGRVNYTGAADVEEDLTRRDVLLVREHADDPFCSTTNQRELSPGACSIATGSRNVRPETRAARTTSRCPSRAAVQRRPNCSDADRGRTRRCRRQLRRRIATAPLRPTAGKQEGGGKVRGGGIYGIDLRETHTGYSRPSPDGELTRGPLQSCVVLGKQNRISRAFGGSSQNGDKGIAATRWRRVSSTQNSASGRSETAE